MYTGYMQKVRHFIYETCVSVDSASVWRVL